MDTPKPIRTLPKGWHAIDDHHPGHKGTKADVIAEIQKDDAIDADLKAYLLAKIQKMDCKALSVHCHLTADPDGGVQLTVHLDPMF